MKDPRIAITCDAVKLQALPLKVEVNNFLTDGDIVSPGVVAELFEIDDYSTTFDNLQNLSDNLYTSVIELMHKSFSMKLSSKCSSSVTPK